MAFNDDTLSKSAFKTLQGKAHTGNAKDLPNETEPTAPTLAVQEVFGEQIPFDPNDAIANGVATFVTLDLELDASSNGKAYDCKITTVSGTGLDGYVNPKTGFNYADGDRVGFLIPPKFDEPSDPPPTESYRAILYDNGVEVAPSDASNWFLDYRAGIVVSETDLSLGVTGTVDGYVYIGDFAVDRLDFLETGVGTWQTAGSNTQHLNPGNVLPGVDASESFGTNVLRWQDGYFSGLLSGDLLSLTSSADVGTDLTVGDELTVNTDSLVVTSGGLTGIGTATPNERLEVSGGLQLGTRASDLNADGGVLRWNDYHLQGHDGYQWKNLTNRIAYESFIINTDTSTLPTFSNLNIFAADNWFSFVEGATWIRRSTGGLIDYVPEDGYFICKQAGAYRIQAELLVEQSGGSTNHDYLIMVNGNQEFFATAFHSVNEDPMNRPMGIIKSLSVGDIVEFRMDTGGNAPQIRDGTTVNFYAIGPDHASVTFLANQGSITSETNVWDETIHGGAAGFIQGTDWDYNVHEQNILYTQSDGRFTVKREGVYLVNFFVYTNTSSSGNFTIRLKKNGTTEVTAVTGSQTTYDPQVRSLTAMLELQPDDYVEITMQGSTEVIYAGTTLNMYRVGYSAAKFSAAINTSATATTAEVDIWASSTYPSFVEGVDWNQLVEPRFISLDTSTGAFTIKEDGTYYIEHSIFVGATSSTFVAVNVDRNGTSIYNTFVGVSTLSNQDPTNHTISFCIDLVAGETLNFTSNGSGSTTVESGTTVNIHKLQPHNAQPGPWSVAGTSTDLYHMTGNVGVGTSSPQALLHVSTRVNNPASILIESNADGGAPGTSRPYLALDDNDSEVSVIGLNQSAGIGPDGGVINDALVDALMIKASGPISPTYMQFATDGTVRMTIDDSGNVGFGKTSPAYAVEIASADTTNGAELSLHLTDPSIVNGDVLGTIWFTGEDSGQRPGAKMWAESTSTWGSDLDQASTVLKFAAQDGGLGSTLNNSTFTVSEDGATVGFIDRPDSGKFDAPNFHVHKGSAGSVTANSASIMTLENDSSGYLQFLTPATDQSGILFGSPTDTERGGVLYDHSTDLLQFRTLGNTTGATLSGGPNPEFRVFGEGTAGIVIDADTNNAGGEDQNPYVRLTQDGINTSFNMSINGVAGDDYLGNTVTGAIDNWAMIHTIDGGLGASSPFSRGIQFATGDSGSGTATVVMTLGYTDKYVGIGTTSMDRLLHLAGNSSSDPAYIRIEDSQTAAGASDVLGAIEFETRDASDTGVAAIIEARYTNSIGNAELNFYTGSASNLNAKFTVGSGTNTGCAASAHDGADPAPSSNVSMTFGTNSGTGSRGYLGMNNNAVPGTPNREQPIIRFKEFSGTNRYMWVDDTGDLRLHTSLVTESTDTNGVVVGTQSFTGMHFYETNAVVDELNDDGYTSYLAVGDAVALVDGYVLRSFSAEQKNVVGIFCGMTSSYKSSLTGEGTEADIYWDGTPDGYHNDAGAGDPLYQAGTTHTFAAIASLGDARDFTVAHELLGFKVCDEGGAIESGDLLCSSSIPGYLMKQSDDLIHSYTIGKALEDVTFDGEGKASGIYGYIYCG